MVAVQKATRRLNWFKVGMLLAVLCVIFLFLRAAIHRVISELDVVGTGEGITTVTLGFLVLFLAGVGYGLWVLLVEYYVALSLTRKWIVQLLEDIGGREKQGEKEFQP